MGHLGTHAELLAQSAGEIILDRRGRRRVGRPLGIERGVAAAAKEDRAVLELLPIVETVARGDRPSEGDLASRSGREHLEARGPNLAAERWHEFLQSTINADDDVARPDRAAPRDDATGGDLRRPGATEESRA